MDSTRVTDVKQESRVQTLDRNVKDYFTNETVLARGFRSDPMEPVYGLFDASANFKYSSDG